MKRICASDVWFFLVRLFRVPRVTEPAGRYLEFTYTDVTANQAAFTTLAQISGTPAAGWNEITVTNTNAYRYLRFGLKKASAPVAVTMPR
jgi:hypothetical protein